MGTITGPGVSWWESFNTFLDPSSNLLYSGSGFTFSNPRSFTGWSDWSMTDNTNLIAGSGISKYVKQTSKNQFQQKIVEKMNQLSNMRINLYQTLSGVNNYYQNALTSTAGTLKDQTAAIYIVESELNKSKERLALLDTEKNNKIRLVEINNYYGDKYAEHSQLMKIIIYILVARNKVYIYLRIN